MQDTQYSPGGRVRTTGGTGYSALTRRQGKDSRRNRMLSTHLNLRRQGEDHVLVLCPQEDGGRLVTVHKMLALIKYNTVRTSFLLIAIKIMLGLTVQQFSDISTISIINLVSQDKYLLDLEIEKFL